jgi:hypothetical protein
MYGGSAFGLDLTASFQVAGLLDEPLVPARPDPTVLARSAAVELERDWPVDAKRICDLRFPEGPRLTIEHADAGFRLEVDDWGVYLISADGRVITFAPPDAEDWRWQRLLTAQVLPLAALLRGRELLHASAVELTGRCVALLGDSGVGKTTLAAHLAARGAPFMTDDVLAISADAGGVSAHPGPGLMNLRHSAAASLGDSGPARLGELVGRDSHGLRLLVRRSRAPLPLGAVYFLRRADAPATEPAVEALNGAGPRELFGAGFNSSLRTESRLRNQLEVYSALAASVPLFRVVIPDGSQPGAVAERIERHARERIGAWGA